MVTNIVNSPHYLFQIVVLDLKVYHVTEKSRDKKSELGGNIIDVFTTRKSSRNTCSISMFLLINVGFCQVL